MALTTGEQLRMIYNTAFPPHDIYGDNVPIDDVATKFVIPEVKRLQEAEKRLNARVRELRRALTEISGAKRGKRGRIARKALDHDDGHAGPVPLFGFHEYGAGEVPQAVNEEDVTTEAEPAFHKEWKSEPIAKDEVLAIEFTKDEDGQWTPAFHKVKRENVAETISGMLYSREGATESAEFPGIPIRPSEPEVPEFFKELGRRVTEARNKALADLMEALKPNAGKGDATVTRERNEGVFVKHADEMVMNAWKAAKERGADPSYVAALLNGVRQDPPPTRTASPLDTMPTP